MHEGVCSLVFIANSTALINAQIRSTIAEDRTTRPRSDFYAAGASETSQSNTMPSLAVQETIAQLRAKLPQEPAQGEATEAYKTRNDLAYLISQLPLGTSRPLKVICAGAGFSGLCFAKQIATKKLENISLTIYEKNASIGGTWFENRYPGCACDIPIHNYQFSWAPYPHFTSYYAAGKDIQDYIERVADQHDLRNYIKTCHKVVCAEWIEDRQKWRVEIVQSDGRDRMASNRHSREGEKGPTFFEECDIFINATGCFSQ